ncbi:MAG: DNA-processing protein DprA [Desulfobacteraceae bacterium]|nr:DNA-processing protein DprA [Desulfobacteraceae bacterium]MCF8094165.1 DNA-processing protein DprA [Desulfobacteraceae bacterium]
MVSSPLRQRLDAWIALRKIPGVGPLMFKRLVDRFGSPEKVFAANRRELCKIEGLSGKIFHAILGTDFSGAAEKEIAFCRHNGCRIITFQDEEYPYRLARIPDPPPYVYAFGRDFSKDPSVAVVGTRSPTRYGISMARRLSADLSAMGFVIISGMALGIDSAAHVGALDAGGKTVAVLGSGISVIYPRQNRGLYYRIAENGTIISELPVHEPPNAYNFPARNRIISGMSLGTVVVEAASKSGSLITARLAAEQGREVFAVPGNINSYKSTGTHDLLKQGAKLVERAEDVVEELAPLLLTSSAGAGKPAGCGANRSKQDFDLTAEELRVYDALDPYPSHIDELSRRLAMDAGSLLAVLSNLELKGMAMQMPGKYFCSTGAQE